MCADVKYFYLNMPMDTYKYMRLQTAITPQEIIEQYNLLLMVHNGHVHVEIWKGMYGLPQSGKIANDCLKKHL